MRSGGDDHLTTQAIIAAAIPRDTAKVLTRALGCTDRQGRRIASGQVPSRFRGALIRILDEAFARNKQMLERALNDLRAIEYQEMVARAADRRAESGRASDEVAPRQGSR
jgi:hypothetical protein